MNKLFKTCLLTTALLAASATTVSAGETIFSYNTGAVPTVEWGTKTAEWYDVAVFVPGSYAGKTVTGVRMPFSTSSSDVQKISLWLSEELSLARNDERKKVADPDIITAEATLANGFAEVRFSEPYTVTENGLYAGATFKVLNVNSDLKCKTPIYLTDEQDVEGTWIHTTTTYTDWEANTSLKLGNSTMQVFLSGMDNYAATPVDKGSIYVMHDEPFNVFVDIQNKGAEEISNIDITYEIGNIKEAKYIEFAEPIEAVIGGFKTIELAIPGISASELYDFKLTVDKVNGQANSSTENSSVTTVGVMAFKAERYPLFEEYTGFWCGYCPSGFIGLERMNHLYPGEFIGVSYHNDDELEIMYSNMFPSEALFYPGAWMDRTFETDPYYGNGSTGFGVPEVWLERRAIDVRIGVEAQADYSADGKTLEAKALLHAAVDQRDVDYRIEFILTADSLYNRAWAQSNYYAGDPNPDGSDDWAVFTDGPSTIRGLYYSDVIISTSRLFQDNTVVSGNLYEGTPAEYTCSFNLSDISLIQDKNKVNIIVVLLNPDGTVYNAHKMRVGERTPGGIGSIETETKAEIVGYYDLTGRKVANPENGIYIVRTSDGKAYKAAF